MTTVSSRLSAVRERIEDAAGHAGRPGDVRLVAVSKTVDAGRICEAYSAGQREFGENRVQEGQAKVEQLRAALPEAHWHLIGRLQSNKARAAVGAFDVIQSIDSLRLARRVSDLALQQERHLSALLEVNVAGEASKTGFTVEDVERSVQEMAGLPGIVLRGLMTVAPQATNPEEVRWVFRALRELRDRIRSAERLETFSELSMGMSGDFEIAIEEGATIVRIGRAIFGERPVPRGLVDRDRYGR